MQHIDSIKLFPYLQHNSLLSDDDMEYICNPRRTENERRRRIIISAPCRDPDAFDRFVDCLSVEHSHPGHTFLAKRMREAIKKKRENPFSETLLISYDQSSPFTCSMSLKLISIIESIPKQLTFIVCK